PDRQEDGEGGADARRRSQVDAAAMRSEQTAGNRQPKSGTAFLPRDAVVDLLEVFKNTVVVRCRNARTCIPHRDDKMVAYCAGMQFHRAGVSELDCVADDIQ